MVAKKHTKSELKKIYNSLSPSEKYGLKLGLFPSRIAKNLTEEDYIELMNIAREDKKNTRTAFMPSDAPPKKGSTAKNKKGANEQAPTLKEYREAIEGQRCRFCGTPLTRGIEGYPHEDGWRVRGYSERQWLYTTCPNPRCHYQWALSYLGIPRNVTAKDLKEMTKTKAKAMVSERGKGRKGSGTSVNRLMKQAVDKGYITCPRCGNHIEPDAERCICGWRNPLPDLGLI